MRHLMIPLIFLFLASCGWHLPQGTTSGPVKKEDSFADPAKISLLKLTNSLQYHQALEHLDPVDLASLSAARTLFSNCASDSLTRDSMFVDFNGFLNNLAASYFENNEMVANQLANSPSSETVNSLKASFAVNGLLLSSITGSFSLEPQSGFLLQQFGHVLSGAYREFLSIRSREQESEIDQGGKIQVSVDSLVTRILTLENFIHRNPGFISIRIARENYAHYLSLFLAGEDNSRAFDPDSHQLNDTLKIAFESFAEKNPESKSAQVVKAYLQMLDLNDFKYSEKVDSFLLVKVYGENITDEQKDQSGHSHIHQ